MNKKPLSFVFIFLGDDKPKLQEVLQAKGIDCEFLPLKQNFVGYLSLIYQLVKIYKRKKIELVHAHLFHASLVGLIAAKVSGIKHRIYTRHHATFHHDYFPHAVKYDRLINSLSTDIVAISTNVKSILIKQENVNPQKIKTIEHGFDLNAFSNVSLDRIEEIYRKYSVPKGKKIIGSIARYINLKGHQYLIQAFKQLHSISKDFHLVLANANGPDRENINAMLNKLPEDSYTEIAFEEDLFALYQTFDVFVHLPINKHVEAFGQTYVEALAAGVPSVFTLSGIASDFIVDGKNAVVVDYKHVKQVKEGVLTILNNEGFRQGLIEKGKESVKAFSIDRMIKQLIELYQMNSSDE
jgi:glycosyltransferase involved in cell wall biosynthesis